MSLDRLSGLSSSFLFSNLVDDNRDVADVRVEDDRQSADRRLKQIEQPGDELFARREGGDVLDLRGRNDLAVEHRALELNRRNVFRELRQGLRQGHGVRPVERDGSHAAELLLERLERRVLHRDQRERVLDDDVLRTRLTDLLAQFGDLRDGDPFEVDEEGVRRLSDAGVEFRDCLCFVFALHGYFSSFTSATVSSRRIDGLIVDETKTLRTYLPFAAGGFALRIALMIAVALSRSW